eukprot:TRINITY_DN14895_c0_g1_i1.p1 TRINITY_DN14895_c0_g1~~TRINITY_DN14895_c0_g1_i1.p1  ORF type:complete len:251 (-),score=62.65 TRINITY_DN14895_c0_g1_i1:101-853(-)
MMQPQRMVSMQGLAATPMYPGMAVPSVVPQMPMQPPGALKAGAAVQAPIFDDGTSAPFIFQYFQLLKSACAVTSISSKAVIRDLNGKLFPFIVQAFKRHDKNGDNVLSKLEAQSFMAIFCSQRLGFQEVFLDLAAARLRGDRQKAGQFLGNYIRNQVSMNAAGVQALSSDEEGVVQMHEVLAALSLGTPQHSELMAALGVYPPKQESYATYYEGHYAGDPHPEQADAEAFVNDDESQPDQDDSYYEGSYA